MPLVLWFGEAHKPAQEVLLGTYHKVRY
ncbi:protein of unknown function (plasmid) [Cupriavidus neocaledonicus]|uniref:Uncharacterized protein n=1 Tax=Cupriavidus neocaledonicus TaxID=1040979 RepID=A0A375HVW8_9BURK|nr:hypothetical protein CBM2605_B40009 [Cupriavidus neocaledonicus]SPD60994.1 protein of unknown function [Cupriavidus neocaledonicus]